MACAQQPKGGAVKTLALLLLIASIVLTVASVIAAVPANLSIDPELRSYLNHEVDQSCRGRLVDVTVYDGTTPDPDAPANPPARYWRLTIKIEERYTGRQNHGEFVLTTMSQPPILQKGALVLAYGTKTKSDRGRLWGNVFPMTELSPGRYTVDDRDARRLRRAAARN